MPLDVLQKSRITVLTVYFFFFISTQISCLFFPLCKDTVKRDKTPIKELASASGTTKVNGNEPSEEAASTSTRKPSIENIPSSGRRPSRGLEILGIGAASTRSKSPRTRSPNPTMSRSRSPAPNARKYKYWMMVDWTPEVFENIDKA